MSALRIQDAKPGDVLWDLHGDEWTITQAGATFRPVCTCGPQTQATLFYAASRLPIIDVTCGPFFAAPAQGVLL